VACSWRVVAQPTPGVAVMYQAPAAQPTRRVGRALNRLSVYVSPADAVRTDGLGGRVRTGSRGDSPTRASHVSGART